MRTITFGGDTYNIYDNTSVENVRFEDHDSIVRLPVIFGSRIIKWLEENKIPYERIKWCNLPENLRKPYVLGFFHYHSGCGIKTNINPDDLRMMALTLAEEETDDYKRYTSDSDNVEDDNTQTLMDLFADVPEEDGWTDFC